MPPDQAIGEAKLPPKGRNESRNARRGWTSPGGVGMVSELLREDAGEAPGLRFGEIAVETDTNWLAFMKA